MGAATQTGAGSGAAPDTGGRGRSGPRTPSPPAQLLASVVAALAVTVVTAGLGTTPEAKLAAAAVGALLPAFITFAGPWFEARLALGVAIAAAGLAMTYLGVKAYDAVTDETTYPSPREVAQDVGLSGPPPPAQGGGGGGGPPAPQLRAEPGTLTCTAGSGCDSGVRIANVGGGSLRVGEIRREGDGAPAFSGGEACEGHVLAAGQTCAFDVGFTGTGTVSATLVVEVEPGVPATVALQGSGPPADLAVAANCTISADGAATVAVTVTGGEGSAVVRATPDAGAPVTREVPVGAPQTIPLSGGVAEVSVQVDPDGLIDESNETNNLATDACGA